MRIALLAASITLAMASTASLAATAYVSNEKDDSISVIDLASQTVTETLKVGMRPRGLLLSSDNKLLYICASDSDRVQVMDLATRKIIKELPSGADPEQFALTFMNFIKLVNGSQGESHKTPPVHLKMLDKVISPSNYIANLCFRGAAKTTLFMEYFSLFLGMFHYIPGFGPVDGMIYVSDSMENGVKSARKNIEFRYNNSEFAQEWIPHAKFTDNYLEFGNRSGELLGIKMFGAKTGLRGTKIFGKRPTVAILDDLVNDDDANSRAAMLASQANGDAAVEEIVEEGRSDEQHGDQHDGTDGSPAERKTSELIEIATTAADMEALEAAQAEANKHLPALPDDLAARVTAALDAAEARILRNQGD